MTKRLLCVGCIVMVLASAAHAASFNCAKAVRPVEKLICNDPRLNAADESLGQNYRAGVGKLPAAAVGLLRADQVQWLAWMEEICHAPLPETAPLPEPNRAGVTQCMLPLYAERNKQLRSVVTERDGVHFMMRTQFLAAPEQPAASGSASFPGFGTLQVMWPFALADGPEWQAWNHAAEVQAHALADDGAPAKGATAMQPVQWMPYLAEDADTRVTLLVRRIEHGRVTGSAAMSTMGHGAAHPSEASRTMTWLLQEKRALHAEDVFQPGDAWKQLLAQACWTTLHTDGQSANLYPQVTGPNGNELQGVIADVGNWTLEHDGLHISYPEYSVAPRVAPVDDTAVLWRSLQAVLARGFTAP